MPPEKAVYEWGDDKQVRVCDDCGRHFANNFDKCPRCGGDWTWQDALGGGVKGKRQGNGHPCVKPIALARYLAMLLLPPAEYAPRRILVPFAGVGSEAIGAALAGWEDVTGIEAEAEYVEMARARARYWLMQPAMQLEAAE